MTADDFDKSRGKLNVRQSLIERVEAVRGTGLADEIVVEEYEGQKIDDIRRYGVDIFAIGSDWKGQFDYLSEYCRVVYLDRTEGVSSSQLRSSGCPTTLQNLCANAPASTACAPRASAPTTPAPPKNSLTGSRFIPQTTTNCSPHRMRYI